MESDAPAHVLLVDDRPENLLALSAILDRPDIEITTASSGSEALRQILHREFAVIVLDIQMPDMDGFETAQLIRAREKSSKVPIIFATAIHKSEEHVAKGYGLGASDYLFKPLIPEVVRSKVQVFIELERYRRRLLHLEKQEQERLVLQTMEEQRQQQERQQYELLLRELGYAREIQQCILPQHLEAYGCKIFANVRPARQVGGDFYDVLLDDHRTTCVIGDVMGKGMPAALSMVLAVTVLREAARHNVSAEALLTNSNREIFDRLGNAAVSNAVSVGVLTVDPEERRLSYAKAGHEDMLHYRARTGEVEALSAKGFFLGLLQDGDYHETSAEFEPGDKVVLYTDGIPDARNGERDFFGLDRLVDTVAERGRLSPEELGTHIIQEVDRFQAGADPTDDIGLMVVQLS